MKVLVLGDGLLGSEIVKQTGWDYISRKKHGFDITKPENFSEYLIESYEGVAFVNKYDVLINCIAHTDTYSTDKNLHWDINFKSVIELSNFCNTHNIKLVHISTDYVYTNSINNASENDVPIHGNNWYSYTKLLGDAYVQLNEKNLVFRCTHKKYPFPYDEAWIDQLGNFDYVNTISKLIIKGINSNLYGLYNVGTELKTMFDLANKSKNAKPIFSKDVIPKNVSMNIDKLKIDLNEESLG